MRVGHSVITHVGFCVAFDKLPCGSKRRKEKKYIQIQYYSIKQKQKKQITLNTLLTNTPSTVLPLLHVESIQKNLLLFLFKIIIC